ncbi:MAG: hypothetical protein HY076_01690 [Candidatus Eisenbacteria bacterium]|uniref:LamG domain-containing protein n=1 Tax=Eiseniibacteriota bacterium TaxID=2212470 RepID=A0A9D6L6Y5_UNCEI|nr:hypothetical protein [Candidatus Eisenbacteria bacterium]MBI3538969.1 hypothetical protein [Candidatus Eisenbacteria bacterium]
MRKYATPLIVLGLIVALAAPAGAVVLMAETFTYPNGNLAGNGTWTTHSGAGTDIQVSTGQALGNMANAPDDNATFAAQSATAKTYVCLQVKIPTPAATPVTNYFAHFKDATTFDFNARIYVMPSGSTFTFGLSTGSCASPCVIAQWPSALAYDTYYELVASYDAAAGSVELWVNPTAITDPKITHSTWSGTTSQVGMLVSAYALRQSTGGIPSGTSNWTYLVDNIAVGTTFDFICAAPTPTQSSTWGKIKTVYR